jgi:hypothetical protein
MTRILVTGVLPEKARHRLEQSGVKLVVRGANDLIEEANFIQAIKNNKSRIGSSERSQANQLSWC